VARIAAVNAERDLPFDFGERINCQGCRLPPEAARGADNQGAHDFRRDRLVEKPAAGDSRIDGFEHVIA